MAAAAAGGISAVPRRAGRAPVAVSAKTPPRNSRRFGGFPGGMMARTGLKFPSPRLAGVFKGRFLNGGRCFVSAQILVRRRSAALQAVPARRIARRSSVCCRNLLENAGAKVHERLHTNASATESAINMPRRVRTVRPPRCSRKPSSWNSLISLLQQRFRRELNRACSTADLGSRLDEVQSLQ